MCVFLACVVCFCFSLCDVCFLASVMCPLGCVMCCFYAYDPGKPGAGASRPLRSLRARCERFAPAAGASRPLRALHAHNSLKAEGAIPTVPTRLKQWRSQKTQSVMKRRRSKPSEKRAFFTFDIPTILRRGIPPTPPVFSALRARKARSGLEAPERGGRRPQGRA